MADDIVTRLRHVSWLAEEGSEVTDLAATAADEIERLRAELEEAYDACRYALAQSPRWQENCANVIATWEADRG